MQVKLHFGSKEVHQLQRMDFTHIAIAAIKWSAVEVKKVLIGFHTVLLMPGTSTFFPKRSDLICVLSSAFHPAVFSLIRSLLRVKTGLQNDVIP